MTRARYVLAVLAAALFTLALGIALGGGPLQAPVQSAVAAEPDVQGDGGEVTPAELAQRNRRLSRAQEYGSAFVDAVAPETLAGKLSGRSVVVLSLPGVPSQQADAVGEGVEAAGGKVTSSLSVGKDLVDPTARALVDELSSRLVPEIDNVDVPEDTPVYTRLGTVMSRALLTTGDGGVAMDDTGRSVFNTFTTARLLRGPEPQQRASLAVVVLPEGGRTSPTTAARGTILTEMATAMDEAGDGVVVAGPPSSAERGGLLAALRAAPGASERVSSVDTVDTSAGQAVSVLALAEQAGGSTGHYGIAGSADAVMPGQAGE